MTSLEPDAFCVGWRIFMNSKLAITAVVVIVVVAVAAGTYLMNSDDDTDDGIEVIVSQPSVGDYVTFKVTESDGVVWELTNVLSIAEDDLTVLITTGTFMDRLMWEPVIMGSVDEFLLSIKDSADGYDLIGTETIDTAFGPRECNIYDVGGVRYWICPENDIQYKYVQDGAVFELVATSMFEGADGLELSQLSDTRSLSVGDYVNMTRYDNDYTRDFYLLVTGVEDGVYEVEYPNGSETMTEEAFYDRLGAVDQLAGSELIGESVAFVDVEFVPADLYYDPVQGEYLLVCSDGVCYISINAEGSSVISSSTLHQDYVEYETDIQDLSPEVGDVLYLTMVEGDLDYIGVLTDCQSAGIVRMEITSVDGDSLTYEYTNLVTGETSTQTSTVQDFVQRIQPDLDMDSVSITVRETVYGSRLCYAVQVDNEDGSVSYSTVGVGSGILYQQDIYDDNGMLTLNYLSGYTVLGETDAFGSGTFAVYDDGDGGKLANIWIVNDTGYNMIAADSEGGVWVLRYDSNEDIEVAGDPDVFETRTVMGEEVECYGYTSTYSDGSYEITWYTDGYIMPVFNEQYDSDGSLLVNWSLMDTNSIIASA